MPHSDSFSKNKKEKPKRLKCISVNEKTAHVFLTFSSWTKGIQWWTPETDPCLSLVIFAHFRWKKGGHLRTVLSVFSENWVYSLRNWNHIFLWFQIFCTLESLRDQLLGLYCCFKKKRGVRKPKHDKRASSFSSSVLNNPSVSVLFNKVCKIWHYFNLWLWSCQ